MTSVSITVTGKVQDVWYRKYTLEKAIDLGLTGTVQNLDNGDVLIIASGTEEQVQSLIDWTWQGSPQSNVANVTVTNLEAREFSDFRISE